MKLPQEVSIPLNTPYLSNKYTKWYYSLIYLAQNRKNVELYTEKHHIIPVCMFKHNNRSVYSQGYLQGNPNEKINLVWLTYREHFVVHWLLTKMLSGVWRYKMESALAFFKSTQQGSNLSGIEIQRQKKALKLKQQGITWWNNGSVQLQSLTQPGPEFVAGMLPSSTKDYKFYHNGSLQTRAPKSPGPEWRPGRSPSAKTSKGIKWWNNGIESVQSYECPGDGWIHGRFRSTQTRESINNKLKGLKWWTDGLSWKRAKTCPGTGWYNEVRKTNVTKTRGLRFWHNGVTQTMAPQCPGNGWHPGRLPGSSPSLGKANVNKGRKLWNNGTEQKTSHTCPGDGWTQGRLR